MASTTVARQPNEGEAFWLLGGLYELKVAAAETDGALTIVEMHLPAGLGPPPHTHPGAESVYVLEGRIRYHIEDEQFEGGPGASFHVPQGTVENFEPIEDSRLLVVYTPGGIEGFFAEAGEPAARRELPPPPTEPPDLARLIEIGEKHGMRIATPA
jgi:quercetin dioxygenase-like cupin family protein